MSDVRTASDVETMAEKRETKFTSKSLDFFTEMYQRKGTEDINKPRMENFENLLALMASMKISSQ